VVSVDRHSTRPCPIAERPDHRDGVDSRSAALVRALGAHEVLRQGKDLAKEELARAPDGVEWIFTTSSDSDVSPYFEVAKPFGQIVATGDPEQFDVILLKPKALSVHWEFMFVRPSFQTDDMIKHHRLLSEVSRLVDDGVLRSTMTRVLSPINAEQLREAHRIVEQHEALGKVVVARP
jgi:NADPH:quinone reductase